MNHLRATLAGILFNLLLVCIVVLPASAQTADLRLATQLNCPSRQYLATLQIRASDATSFSIGTSSVFLSYDPSSLTFVGYQSLNFNTNTLCGGQSLWDTHSFDGSTPGLFNLTMVLNSSSISCPLITNTGWVDIGTITFNVLNPGGNPSLLFNPSFTSFNAVPANNGVAQIQQGQFAGLNQTGALQCIAPCSMSVAASPSVCNPATNTYTLSGTATLANATQSGAITVSAGTPQSFSYLAGASSVPFSLSGLVSDGTSHTLTVSNPACGTVNITYTAPSSCSVAPVCLLTATATAGPCNPAANTYAVTGTVSATNTSGNQSLTISAGSVNTVLTMTSNGPVSYTLTGLPSDGLVKTVSISSSPTACGSASVTYTAPLSCSTTCPAPISVCQGSSYAIELSGLAGLGTYQWYRNGQAITGATTNSLTATQAGSYSLVINGDGTCLSGSCCPTLIVEVAGVPSFSAVSISPACSGTIAQANGQVSLSGLGSFTLGQYTYQYSVGSSFSSVTAQPSVAANVPVSGLIISNLVGGETLTIRVVNALTGCYLDQTVLIPVPNCASCPPAACLPIVVTRIK